MLHLVIILSKYSLKNNKKMKKITTILLALFAFTVFSFAQEEDSYTMFENTRLVVKTDSYKEFGKAMAHHNKTYHAEGPYHANVWSVTVGEDAGHMIWSMGPCTYTEHDGRPSGTEHMEDWLYNVMPNVKYIDESNMWKMADKLSYSPNEEGSPKLSIRIFDLEDGQSYRFKEIMKKVIKVYSEKNYERSIATYWSEFNVNADEDVAIVWGFSKWAMFDEDPKFKGDFEEIHGEGSWQSFRDELKGAIKGAKDEVWEIIPELSGSE